MTAPKILLDPVDFDALHLSALAFGGIGATQSFERTGVPYCVVGHGAWLDGADYAVTAEAMEYASPRRFDDAGLTYIKNDDRLCPGGVDSATRVPFEQYIQLLNIDIKEPAA